MTTGIRLLLGIVAPVAVFSSLSPAQSSIIPIGSPLVFGGTNSPDTYTANTTFSSTPVLVDNGALKIWQKQIADSSTSEWDIFYMQTTSGGPLANDVNSYWDIVMNYDLSAPANFDATVNQWLVNGVPVSPLTNGIGSLCCASASNPILSGEAYYNSGFTNLLQAGVHSGWRQIFVTPYNYVSAGGVNPNTANEFIYALHFTLQPATSTFTTVLAPASQIEPFAPEAIVSAYGTNLAAGIEGATTVPLPEELQGTSITITDSAGVQTPIALYYVSPLQINYEIPAGVAPGYATVTLTPSTGTVQTEQIQIGSISPGIFQLDSSGLVAAWVLPDLSGVQQPLLPVYQFSGNSLVPLPVNLEVSNEQIYLEVYGTGIRYAKNVSVTVGGLDVPVLYSGVAPGEVGEDQINIGPLPTSLAGKGSVDIVLTADGQTANTVNITIQ